MNNDFKELREAIAKHKVHDPTNYIAGVSLEYLRPILAQADELLQEYDEREKHLLAAINAGRISKVSHILHGHPALRRELEP